MGSMEENRYRLIEAGAKARDLFTTDNRITMAKARDNFGGVATLVAHHGSHVVLTKGSDHMGVIVPIGWYLAACEALGHDPATTLAAPVVQAHAPEPAPHTPIYPWSATPESTTEGTDHDQH